jgi:hypothetical protein
MTKNLSGWASVGITEAEYNHQLYVADHGLYISPSVPAFSFNNT